MSIRNWFVRSESIRDLDRGALSYGYYLINSNHPNHNNKTKIRIVLNNPVSIAIKSISESQKINLRNAINKKGGRPVSSYMQSYVFSLPEEICLKDHQWNMISKRILFSLEKHLSIHRKELIKYVSIVIHEQSNTHLNLIISRSINGRSFQKELTRPSTTNLLKSVFNNAVLECGYSFEDYTPKNKRSKRLKRWEEISHLEKNLKTLIKQEQRFDAYNNIGDLYNANRTRNRMLKRLSSFDFNEESSENEFYYKHLYKLKEKLNKSKEVDYDKENKNRRKYNPN